MVLISVYETTYRCQDDDEGEPSWEQTSQIMTDEPVTFIELVSMMRHYPNASCSHPRGEPFEWLSTEAEEDYKTGAWTSRSLHFSHKNTTHSRRYWRIAMEAARFIRL